MADLQTIADFHLSRKADIPKPRDMFDFMTPFIGNTRPRDWNHQYIFHPHLSGGYAFFNYATCVEKGAFIIFRSFLTQDPLPASEYLAHLFPAPAPIRITASHSE